MAIDWERKQREWENERAQEMKDVGCFMGDAYRAGYSIGTSKVVILSFPSIASLTWERVRRNLEDNPAFRIEDSDGD